MPQLELQQTLLIDGLALAVVGYLAVRQFREKRVRVATLWVLPALMFLFSFNSIQSDLLDSVYSPVVIGLAFVAGLGGGALRGALIQARVDLPTRSLIVKGTPLSVVIWLVLLAVKALGDVAIHLSALRNTPIGVAAGLSTAALLTFSLATLIATRIYLYWRYSLATVQG